MKTLLKTNLFLSCIIVLLCFGITALSYGQAVVSVDPVESPSPAAGGQLAISLKITSGRNVAAYEVGVNFDTRALRYVSSTNGSYLPAGAFFAPPRASRGKVTVTATSVSGTARATSGTLASITFEVVSVKKSTLRLTDVILSDSNGKVLAVTTKNGTVVEGGTKWDPNGDCKVNVLDLVLVATSLGTSNARTDINGDGKVNVLDLVLVAQHLGESPCGGVTTPPVTPPPVTTRPVTPASSTEGMVLIPAGEFRMGSNSGGYNNEKPVHSVYVDAFYMDKYEVTNAQYAAFLNAKGKHAEAGRKWLDIGDGSERIEYVAGVYRAKGGYENHPVVEVSWYGAVAYSKWKGKRLPTEAEWEKAARGNLSGLKYPWGNSIDRNKANYGHIGDTTAVGKYAANGYGLYDMAGNVWEWCLDEYNSGFYAVSSSQNPLSGANSIRWILDNYTGVRGRRVIRGGSWNPLAPGPRVAYRFNTLAGVTGPGLGFRCARTVSP